MKGEDLLLIPKSEENNQSDVYNGTWLEMVEDAERVKMYGSKVYCTKEGIEYLIIQTDLEQATAAQVININEYHSYGWDEIED